MPIRPKAPDSHPPTHCEIWEQWPRLGWVPLTVPIQQQHLFPYNRELKLKLSYIDPNAPSPTLP